MTRGSSSSGAVIEQVWRGMPVVDVNGERVGPVEYVQMGDPGALTTAEAEASEPWSFAVGEALAGQSAEPCVPEPLRSRLLISGFVKIDGPGPDLWDTDL